MARVLIAGCGYVGTALGVELAGAAHEVVGLRRRAEALPSPIRGVAADLREIESLRKGLGPLGDLDLLVYAAAASERSDAGYRAAYVDGLRNVLEVVGDVRHVFFTSSTSVYAQQDGSRVDESSPTEPVHWTGVRMLEAERVLAASGRPATALRLGGIYGPGRTRLARSVLEGRAQRRAGPVRWTNRIHRDDAAGALHHLIGRALDGSAPESLYLGVDDEPADQNAVLLWLAEFLSVRPPPVAEADGESPSARPASSKRCSNERLRGAGYRLRYPTFREGYAAVLSEDPAFTSR